MKPFDSFFRFCYKPSVRADFLKEASWYVRTGWECFVLGRRKPFFAGIPVTDRCNLHCVHCVVAHAGRGDHSIQQIGEWMRLLYGRGARFLSLQGGEAFGWGNGDLRLDEVIRLARKIGYFRVAAVTNGTYPIESTADLVWVSIDGLDGCHDRIRGAGTFAALRKNLDRSSHPRIMANMTVNRLNRQDVGRVARFAAEHPKLSGVSFNLHTPYQGVEDLALDAGERSEVCSEIIRLKESGFPVLNTRAGLDLLRSGKYQRPVWAIQMVEQGKVFECCWGREQPGVCQKCGYGVIAELSLLSRFRPGSILHALRTFAARGSAL